MHRCRLALAGPSSAAPAAPVPSRTCWAQQRRSRCTGASAGRRRRRSGIGARSDAPVPWERRCRRPLQGHLARRHRCIGKRASRAPTFRAAQPMHRCFGGTFCLLDFWDNPMDYPTFRWISWITRIIHWIIPFNPRHFSWREDTPLAPKPPGSSTKCWICWIIGYIHTYGIHSEQS
jgi:hypothetical protein